VKNVHTIKVRIEKWSNVIFLQLCALEDALTVVSAPLELTVKMFVHVRRESMEIIVRKVSFDL
jgi:hypothetical protein